MCSEFESTMVITFIVIYLTENDKWLIILNNGHIGLFRGEFL